MADKFNKGDNVIIVHTGERGTIKEKKKGPSSTPGCDESTSRCQTTPSL